MRLIHLFCAAACIVIIGPGQLAAQAAHAHKNPCNLLSASTAAALLGTTVKPGQDLGAMCVFAHEEGQDVVIGVLDAPGNGAPAAFQSAIQQEKDKKAEPVPNVGEMASYLKAPTESDLHVLFHGKIISLGVRRSKNANLKPAMIQTVKNLLPGF